VLVAWLHKEIFPGGGTARSVCYEHGAEPIVPADAGITLYSFSVAFGPARLHSPFGLSNMKCPKCDSVLVDGEVYLGAECSGLANGYLELVFKTAKWSKHLLQEPTDKFPAHYCDACGVFVVEGRRRGLSSLE